MGNFNGAINGILMGVYAVVHVQWENNFLGDMTQKYALRLICHAWLL